MTLLATPIVRGIDLPGAVAAQYTCPTNQNVLLKHGVFCNHTTGTVAITVYIVPAGASPAAANKIIDAYSITAHTTYVSPEVSGVVLQAGDSVQCFAGSATSIAINLSGIVQS